MNKAVVEKGFQLKAQQHQTRPRAELPDTQQDFRGPTQNRSKSEKHTHNINACTNMLSSHKLNPNTDKSTLNIMADCYYDLLKSGERLSPNSCNATPLDPEDSNPQPQTPHPRSQSPVSSWSSGFLFRNSI